MDCNSFIIVIPANKNGNYIYHLKINDFFYSGFNQLKLILYSMINKVILY